MAQEDGSNDAERNAARQGWQRPVLIGASLACVVLLLLGILGLTWTLARHADKPATIAAQSTAVATPSPDATPAQTAVTRPSAAATSGATSTAPVGPAQVPHPAVDQVVTVLMYHHIMPVPNNKIAISPSTFDTQMKYLHDHGWHAISMAELEAFVLTGKRLPSKPVLITFDDDRMNQLTYGVPILKKYGFTATFFIVKNWAESSSPSFMHEPQLKGLIADGFDVESHTSNHMNLYRFHSRSTGKYESNASMKARMWYPTNGMRLWMDRTLGGPSATALAYPGGQYDVYSERLVRQAGYKVAFTTDEGYVTYKGQNQFALPRWNTGARSLSHWTFIKILNDAGRQQRAK